VEHLSTQFIKLLREMVVMDERNIMKVTVQKFLLLTMFALMSQNALGQPSDYPLFHHDVVVKASQEDLKLGRIDIFAEVLYDDMQFLKTADNFEANYELTAILLDGKDQVDGKIWKESVVVDTYTKTNSRNDISLTHATFDDVEPGKYKIVLAYEDLESGQTYKTDGKVLVDNFSKPAISGSGITFARRVEIEDNQVKGIFPEVTNNYKGLGFPAHAYFEVYNPNGYKSAKVNYEILAENSKNSIKDGFDIQLEIGRTAYAIPLPTDSLGHDTYHLTIDINADGKKAILKKDFFIRWAGLPRTAEDLDAAISQVQLIATNKEWKKLKKASEANKLEYFLSFWTNRDPSPITEENEEMEAFYAKVSAADQNFSVMGRKGWRSDRGLIFILLGPPDEVVRNDYPSGSRPYQIWQYYSINRQFEFYDRNGFGDYELINPVSIYDIQRYARKR
jgi:GWxTD domain-containing protein